MILPTFGAGEKMHYRYFGKVKFYLLYEYVLDNSYRKGIEGCQAALHAYLHELCKLSPLSKLFLSNLSLTGSRILGAA